MDSRCRREFEYLYAAGAKFLSVATAVTFCSCSLIPHKQNKCLLINILLIVLLSFCLCVKNGLYFSIFIRAAGLYLHPRLHENTPFSGTAGRVTLNCYDKKTPEGLWSLRNVEMLELAYVFIWQWNECHWDFKWTYRIIFLDTGKIRYSYSSNFVYLDLFIIYKVIFSNIIRSCKMSV